MESNGEPIDFVIAHDYLTQRGGAERVALTLADELIAREIVTAVVEPTMTFAGFSRHRIRSSWLQRFGALRRDPRRALPLLGYAWRSLAPVDADVVICSSSGWAHGVATSARTVKLVYCHNPARWLYQADEYASDWSVPVRLVLRALTPGLRRWDARAAASADGYIANSRAVAERIRRTYGIEAEVVHPPVRMDVDADAKAPESLSESSTGFFLTVGRSRGYKRIDLLVESFRAMPERRLVIVSTPTDEPLPPNVVVTGRISDAELRWCYANAAALVSVSHEDFGLTPIEANAFGTPVLVLRDGGFIESTDDGVSGLFIEAATVEAVHDAVLRFERHCWDANAIRAHAARFSPARFADSIRQAAKRAIDARVAREGSRP